MSNTVEVDIQMLWIDSLDPHPWNPRPWSEKHQSWVNEEKVDDLIALIDLDGYDVSQPIMVRVSPNDPKRFQIIRGHQRTAAQKKRGEASIPGVVRDLDDTEAGAKLVTDQGQSLDMWSKATHAWRMCKAYGGDGLMSVSEYGAKVANRDNSTVSLWIGAVDLRVELEKSLSPERLIDLSVKAARDLALLNSADWGWMAQLSLDNSWTQEQRETAIKAVKSIKIPEHFQYWLDPVEAKKDAVQVCIYFPGSKESPQKRIQGLVSTAQKYLDKLAPRKVPKFRDRMPYWEELDLPKMFLDRLPSIVEPTVQKVEQLWAAIVGECDALTEKFKAWENAQASEEEQRKASEESERDRIATKAEYSPKAFSSLEDAYEAYRAKAFNVVFSVYPEDMSCEDWLGWATDSLVPDGVLICPVWGEDLFEIHKAIDGFALELLDRIVWHRTDETASDRFMFDHEDILVFVKSGGSPSWISESRESDVISDIPLSRPDLLSIKLLTLFSHPNDNILVAADWHKRRDYVGKKEALGAFAIASKRLGRKTAIVETDDKLIKKLSGAIDDAPFSWEV